MSISVHLMKNLLSFGDYFQYSFWVFFIWGRGRNDLFLYKFILCFFWPIFSKNIFFSFPIHSLFFCVRFDRAFFFATSSTFLPLPTGAKGQLFVSSLLSQDVCFGRHHIGFYFSCCLLFSYKRCKKVGLAFNIYILLCSFSVVFYNGRRLYC